MNRLEALRLEARRYALRARVQRFMKNQPRRARELSDLAAAALRLMRYEIANLAEQKQRKEVRAVERQGP
jgi:hypothetical protein